MIFGASAQGAFLRVFILKCTYNTNIYGVLDGEEGWGCVDLCLDQTTRLYTYRVSSITYLHF